MADAKKRAKIRMNLSNSFDFVDRFALTISAKTVSVPRITRQ
jgi:hypothetical protein